MVKLRGDHFFAPRTGYPPHPSTDKRVLLEGAVADRRSATVVAVVGPPLTLAGPAARTRRPPLAIRSHTSEVRRLRAAGKGSYGVSDTMAVRVLRPSFGKRGSDMAPMTAAIVVVLIIVMPWGARPQSLGCQYRSSSITLGTRTARSSLLRLSIARLTHRAIARGRGSHAEINFARKCSERCPLHAYLSTDRRYWRAWSSE
jgi:hypothetical protein